MADNTLLLLGGGVVVLYLFAKANPTAAQAQQIAFNQSLQQQRLNQQANQGYIRQGASLLQQLFGSGTAGGTNGGYGNAQAGNTLLSNYTYGAYAPAGGYYGGMNPATGGNYGAG